MKNHEPKRGFSLIEVLVSLCLLSIAIVGLVPLFTLAVQNNLRSNEMSNATFLAQQAVDYLRTLTAAELAAFPALPGESNDEAIDVNRDGVVDFRRIVDVLPQGLSHSVDILIFSSSQQGTTRQALLDHPENFRIKARLHTVIGR